MEKKEKEEKITFQVRITRKLEEEIKKQEGDTNEEKLNNWIKQQQQKNTNIICNLEKNIEKAEHNLFSLILELQIEKTKKEAQEILNKKLQELPDYSKLKELWEDHMMTGIKGMTIPKLRKKWRLVLDSHDETTNIETETFDVMHEDYTKNPEEYKEDETNEL